MNLLTRSIQNIFENCGVEDKINLQILKIKEITDLKIKKYRGILSDGEFWSSAVVFSSKLNSLLENFGNKCRNAVITIFELELFAVMTENGEKRIILIKDFKFTATAQTEVIGSPKEFHFSIVASSSKAIKSKSSVESDSKQFVKFLDIKDLHPSLLNWSIKARAIRKFPMKYWNNQKGSGKIFSCDVFDRSGSVRLTAFNNLAEKYLEKIEVDNVFQISNGQIKPANKQYNNTTSSFEIVVNEDTEIIELLEDIENVPKQVFKLKLVSEIHDNANVGDYIDAIGICWSVYDLEYIYSGNKPLRKRDVLLLDQSGSINVTLWNAEADNFNLEKNSIILIHNGRIGEYDGKKYISITRNSVIRQNPKIPENRFMHNFVESMFFFFDCIIVIPLSLLFFYRHSKQLKWKNFILKKFLILF